MNELSKRVLKIKENFLSEESFNYAVQRINKFPNNKEKWYCDTTDMLCLLITDHYQNNDKILMEIFIKSANKIGINHKFILYNFSTEGTKDFFQNVTYDQIQKLFDMALKYAENYIFS